MKNLFIFMSVFLSLQVYGRNYVVEPCCCNEYHEDDMVCGCSNYTDGIQSYPGYSKFKEPASAVCSFSTMALGHNSDASCSACVEVRGANSKATCSCCSEVQASNSETCLSCASKIETPDISSCCLCCEYFGPVYNPSCDPRMKMAPTPQAMVDEQRPLKTKASSIQ